MKNHLLPFAEAVLLTCAMTGCQKTEHPSSSLTHPQVSASQSSVARGQQLNLTVRDLPGSAMIKWNILPAKGTKVIAEKNNATVFFGNQGNYQVNAVYYADSSASLPYDSSSTPVTVSDSVYNPPPPPAYYSSDNDNYILEPISATDTGGFILFAHSLSSSPCNPQLAYAYSRIDTVINISLTTITSSTNCGNPPTTAKAYIINAALPDGVYNIYFGPWIWGTLTVTDQTYTFNQQYSSNYSVSPMQIPAK